MRTPAMMHLARFDSSNCGPFLNSHDGNINSHDQLLTSDDRSTSVVMNSPDTTVVGVKDDAKPFVYESSTQLH